MTSIVWGGSWRGPQSLRKSAFEKVTIKEEYVGEDEEKRQVS